MSETRRRRLALFASSQAVDTREKCMKCRLVRLKLLLYLRKVPVFTAHQKFVEAVPDEVIRIVL